MKFLYLLAVCLCPLLIAAYTSSGADLPVSTGQTAIRSLCWQSFPDVPRATAEQVRACEVASEAKLEAVDRGSYWFIEPKEESRRDTWITHEVDKATGSIEVKLAHK